MPLLHRRRFFSLLNTAISFSKPGADVVIVTLHFTNNKRLWNLCVQCRLYTNSNICWKVRCVSFSLCNQDSKSGKLNLKRVPLEKHEVKHTGNHRCLICDNTNTNNTNTNTTELVWRTLQTKFGQGRLAIKNKNKNYYVDKNIQIRPTAQINNMRVWTSESSAAV